MHNFSEFTSDFFLFILRDDQKLLAKEIFYRLLLRKRHTINVSICRQVGKTETIVYALLYILIYFDEILGERIRICITAPETGTSTEFFDRLKLACKEFDVRLELSKNDIVLFPNGNRVDKFGLFKNYAKIDSKKSTREGRTFHIVVRDEKHMGDDSIYNDEIVPAMATTGGLDILIGNGGFKNCKAKQISDMFPDKTQILQTIGSITNFEANFEIMRQIMIDEYTKTDNEMFMRWVDSQEAFIEEHGIDSELVQKNLFNKWFTEVSNFIDIERLRSMGRTDDKELYSSTIHLGLDLAKVQDETVLTFTDTESNVRDWQVFKGEYTQQVRDIRQSLLDWKREFTYEYMFVDSTGVGDPVRAMLKEALGDLVVVRGITFSATEKDILARKALKALSELDPRKRFSYPLHHKYADKFEKQMIALQKIFRDDGKMTYEHPKINGARDDFPDSTFLSLYKIQSINTTSLFTTNTIDSN